MPRDPSFISDARPDDAGDQRPGPASGPPGEFYVPAMPSRAPQPPRVTPPPQIAPTPAPRGADPVTPPPAPSAAPQPPRVAAAVTRAPEPVPPTAQRSGMSSPPASKTSLHVPTTASARELRKISLMPGEIARPASTVASRWRVVAGAA